MNEIKHLAARQHPALFYSDIFTPISRGRRKKAVECKRQVGETTVTIAMFHQLDIADQDLLLCILAMGRTVVKTFTGAPEDEKDYFIVDQGKDIKEQELITKLEATFSAKNGALLKPSARSRFSVDQLPALVITTTAYQILIDLGRTTSGADYKWLEESLTRLSRTSFELEDKQYKYGGSKLLSYLIDKNTREIIITLNVLSAHSVWAKNGDYIYTDRRERHALKSDLARSMHDKLCARVRAGEKDKRFYVDNLLNVIFNETNPANVPKQTIATRRTAAKLAAEELNDLQSWKVGVAGKGAGLQLTVSRKKI